MAEILKTVKEIEVERYMVVNPHVMILHPYHLDRNPL